MRCWGHNGVGQLGYPDHKGDVGDDESPASLGNVPVDAAVVQIAAGASLTCVLLADGAVRCWGEEQDQADRLGYGHTENIGDDETPASAGNVPYR